MTQAGALKCGHCAALGPEQRRNIKNELYLEMRAEIFCSNMSRSVTASGEIKINMSTPDDINIEVKEAVHTAWPGLALLGNKPSLLIIITKPWLSLFQINDLT